MSVQECLKADTRPPAEIQMYELEIGQRFTFIGGHVIYRYEGRGWFREAHAKSPMFNAPIHTSVTPFFPQSCRG